MPSGSGCSTPAMSVRPLPSVDSLSLSPATSGGLGRQGGIGLLKPWTGRLDIGKPHSCSFSVSNRIKGAGPKNALRASRSSAFVSLPTDHSMASGLRRFTVSRKMKIDCARIHQDGPSSTLVSAAPPTRTPRSSLVRTVEFGQAVHVSVRAHHVLVSAIGNRRHCHATGCRCDGRRGAQRHVSRRNSTHSVSPLLSRSALGRCFRRVSAKHPATAISSASLGLLRGSRCKQFGKLPGCCIRRA